MGEIKKKTREPIQFYSSNFYHHHKWHLKKCTKQSKVNSSDDLIDYIVFPPALFLDFFSRKLFNFLKITSCQCQTGKKNTKIPIQL